APAAGAASGGACLAPAARATSGGACLAPAAGAASGGAYLAPTAGATSDGACLAPAGGGGAFSFAYIDLSTGDFRATSFPLENGSAAFRSELERLHIREMIIQESILEDFPDIAHALNGHREVVLNKWASWLFDAGVCRQRLEQQFNTTNLKGFGLDAEQPEIRAAGALLKYLDDTAQSLIPHVRAIRVYGDSDFVGIDDATLRNLELIRNLRDGTVQFSLFEVLDEARTAMGRRLLKERLLHPLRDRDLINQRLDTVSCFMEDQDSLAALRELLGKTGDLERLSSRLAMDKAHGRDMLAIKNALTLFNDTHAIGETLGFTFESERAFMDEAAFTRLMQLHALLEKALTPEPPVALTEGNLIRAGYDERLDTLRQTRDNGHGLLEAYLEEERLKTGISNLKIQHNRLIGYFFEVSNVHLAKVPKRFIRRQGVAGGERYSTDKLAELEAAINGASDTMIDLEKRLFLALRDSAKSLLVELAAASRRIAELDVAQSLARAAAIHNWVRPTVDAQNRLFVTDGRHPVVEAHLPSGEFIPNDIQLDGDGVSFALITGPNMAGKSTYLRQAALIAVMAQMGSFVPAREALLGMVDRIYCRVGASDNLARGESTFLVEMNETAYILHTATPQSLVIMDEVGRGTGTTDGLSLAWAVSEELLNAIGCRTLFATHFHELSLIQHPRMANRSMEVLDRHGEIVFLRKLREGPAAESYGIHVARLAGLSERVLNRARELMARLEESGQRFRAALPTEPSLPEAAGANDTMLIPQPLLPEEAASFQQEAASFQEALGKKVKRFVEELFALNENDLTPLDALNLIHGWKQMLDGPVISPDKPRLGTKTRKSSPSRSPSLFD
ncbi:MAG: DNA mismatch repair protein MutS, partial [Treponema sp.]|nr:DNA mismatch repair protein MutS [Treponema sp.]